MEMQYPASINLGQSSAASAFVSAVSSVPTTLRSTFEGVASLGAAHVKELDVGGAATGGGEVTAARGAAHACVPSTAKISQRARLLMVLELDPVFHDHASGGWLGKRQRRQRGDDA